eukprot:jgi/Galph1/5013/GphlegSOOS_G3606.1
MTRFLNKKKKRIPKENPPCYYPLHNDKETNENNPPEYSDIEVGTSLYNGKRSALVELVENNQQTEISQNGKKQRQVRFADSADLVKQYKESLKERLETSESWIAELKNENERLKEELQKYADHKNLMKEKLQIEQEKEDLAAEMLEWKANWHQCHGEKEQLKRQMEQLKEEYEELRISNEKKDSDKDYMFRKLVNMLTRMNILSNIQNNRIYYKCDLENDTKERSVTFELYIDEEQEEIEYVPVHMNNVSHKLPTYLQDNISFDIQNAPTFFTKIMHSLFSK